jgi:hypothetical protein
MCLFLLNSETQSHAEDQDKAVNLLVILYGYVCERRMLFARFKNEVIRKVCESQRNEINEHIITGNHICDCVNKSARRVARAGRLLQSSDS